MCSRVSSRLKKPAHTIARGSPGDRETEALAAEIQRRGLEMQGRAGDGAVPRRPWFVTQLGISREAVCGWRTTASIQLPRAPLPCLSGSHDSQGIRHTRSSQAERPA